MTTPTGPGSPLRAIRCAWWIIPGIWLWCVTSKTALHTGRIKAAFARP